MPEKVIDYLMGVKYTEQKLAQGEHTGNQYTQSKEVAKGQNVLCQKFQKIPQKR